MQIVAAVQMCSTPNLDENLTQAAKLIAQAADSGARLLVLPEMFALLGCGHTNTITHQETAGSGKIQDFLAKIAQRHGIWLVGGTIPLTSNNKDRIRAACIVFDHNGNQAARYDKIHLFDATLSPQESYHESATIEPGQTITTVATPVGKLGLGVCFDLRFPALFAELSQQGVEILAIPAAFTVKTGQAHWETLVRCRALDTLAYVIGAGQGGQHPTGRKTHGHSMIVNPWGEVLAQHTQPGPGFVCASIELDQLYEIRNQLPVIKAGQPHA